MQTTSLKLPDELKERAAAAAERQGMTTHAFMVEAIRRAAESAEQRASFIAEALAADREMLESGLGYDADEVHAWLQAKVRGEPVDKPKARPWRG